ncbi:MAG: Ig-like domain-containing protein [Thermoplasmata archaeon]
MTKGNKKKYYFGCLAHFIVFILLMTSFSVILYTHDGSEKMVKSKSIEIMDSGTDDGWGYNWVNSTGSPSVPYLWEYITFDGIPTDLSSDGWTDKIPLGFNFTFYDGIYDHVYINSNGWVSFTDQAGYQEEDFPGYDSYNCIISPYSTDLNLSDGEVYYKHVENGHDRFVVTWDNVMDNGNPQTFQVVLNETGEFWFNYETLNSPSANVGINNQNSSIGIDYDSEASLMSQLSVKFEYTPPSYRLISTPEYKGNYGDVGDELWYSIKLRNIGTNVDAYDLNTVGSTWTTEIYDSTMTSVISTITLDSMETKEIAVKVDIPSSGVTAGDYDTAELVMTSQNDASLENTATLISNVKAPILLVDDDSYIYSSNTDYTTEKYYMEALEDNGYTYNYWNHTAWGTPDGISPDTHYVTIWFTGNDYGDDGGEWEGSDPTLDGTDRAVLSEYLNHGGRLYLSSIYCYYDLTFYSGDWSQWLREYLSIDDFVDVYSEHSFEGVPGDTIGNELDLSVYSGDFHPQMSWNATSHGKTVDDGVVTHLNSTNDRNVSVRADSGKFRTVYTGFDFSTVNNGTEGNRTILMGRIIDWLIQIPPYKPKNPLPTDGHERLPNTVNLSIEVNDYNGDSMNVSFRRASDNSVIQNVTDVPSGSRAEVELSGLTYGKTYRWYAVAMDDIGESISDTFTFTINNPPNKPMDPSPSHQSSGMEYSVELSVNVSDADGDLMNVTFYNGQNHEIIGENQGVQNDSQTTTPWSDLDSSEIYYWYVISDDGVIQTKSDTWTFVTNTKPSAPSDPKPYDGEKAVGIGNLSLSTYVTDPEGDVMDVTFYDASDDSVIGRNNEVVSGTRAETDWEGLTEPGKEFKWYAIADDGLDTRRSLTFSFISNHPPETPINPSPEDGETDVGTTVIISVDLADIDEELMNVTFFDASDDTEIGNRTEVDNGTEAVTWRNLETDNTYEWYVVVSDGKDEVTSSTWSFTTESGNPPPDAPTNPSPSHEETGVSTSPTLSVDVSDPDGDTMSVTFYDASDNSTIDSQTGVASGGFASVTWSGLSAQTPYQWYVIVNDGESDTKSDTWNFTTGVGNQAPDSPINASPPDGATDTSLSPDLSVEVSDPDGDTLTVTFYDASDDSEIDSDSGVSSGSTSSVTWTGLSSETEYEWYVIVEDNELSTESDTWSFTTGVDDTPPSIVSTTPSDGATDVDTDTDIEIVLDEAIDSNNIDITISSNDGDVSGTPELSTNNKEITFTPDSDLSPDTEYTVSLTVQDYSGNILTHEFTFTTAAGADSDGDGMPDEWEIEHGLDPNDPDDADKDPDGDGKTNLEEYQEGTDPQKAEGDDGFPMWIIAVIVVIGVAVVFLFFFMQKGKEGDVEGTEEESEDLLEDEEDEELGEDIFEEDEEGSVEELEDDIFEEDEEGSVEGLEDDIFEEEGEGSVEELEAEDTFEEENEIEEQ